MHDLLVFSDIGHMLERVSFDICEALRLEGVRNEVVISQELLYARNIVRRHSLHDEAVVAEHAALVQLASLLELLFGSLVLQWSQVLGLNFLRFLSHLSSSLLCPWSEL